MIRKLASEDKTAALNLLGQDQLRNLYMISNLQQLGFYCGYCEFWGDFPESVDRSPAKLLGILNRYGSGWSLYGEPRANWQGFASIIDADEVDATRLQDNPGGIESLLPHLSEYEAQRISEEQLMALEIDHYRPARAPKGYRIRRATMDDFESLVTFYSDAGTMVRTRETVERPLRDLRVWVAEGSAGIHAAALTNAETATAAMIGGVYTLPRVRGRGLSSAVCSDLVCELLSEGKQPVLYWEAPAAGYVYAKLGFHDIGVWRSVWLRRRNG